MVLATPADVWGVGSGPDVSGSTFVKSLTAAAGGRLRRPGGQVRARHRNQKEGARGGTMGSPTSFLRAEGGPGTAVRVELAEPARDLLGDEAVDVAPE